MWRIVRKVCALMCCLDLLSVEVYMIEVGDLRRSATSAGRSFHVCVDEDEMLMSFILLLILPLQLEVRGNFGEMMQFYL